MSDNMPNNQKVRELVSMGFSDYEARRALLNCNNSVSASKIQIQNERKKYGGSHNRSQLNDKNYNYDEEESEDDEEEEEEVSTNYKNQSSKIESSFYSSFNSQSSSSWEKSKIGQNYATHDYQMKRAIEESIKDLIIEHKRKAGNFARKLNFPVCIKTLSSIPNSKHFSTLMQLYYHLVPFNQMILEPKPQHTSKNRNLSSILDNFQLILGRLALSKQACIDAKDTLKALYQGHRYSFSEENISILELHSFIIEKLSTVIPNLNTLFKGTLVHFEPIEEEKVYEEFDKIIIPATATNLLNGLNQYCFEKSVDGKEIYIDSFPRVTIIQCSQKEALPLPLHLPVEAYLFKNREQVLENRGLWQQDEMKLGSLQKQLSQNIFMDDNQTITIQRHLKQTLNYINRAYKIQHGNIAVAKDAINKMIDDNLLKVEEIKTSIKTFTKNSIKTPVISPTIQNDYTLFALILQKDDEHNVLIINSFMDNKWYLIAEESVEIIQEDVIMNITKFGKYLSFVPRLCIYVDPSFEHEFDFSSFDPILKERVLTSEAFFVKSQNAELEREANAIIQNIKQFNNKLEDQLNSCRNSKQHSPPQNIYEVYSQFRDPFVNSLGSFMYAIGNPHWEYFEYTNCIEDVLSTIKDIELEQTIKDATLNMNSIQIPNFSNSVYQDQHLHNHYVDITRFILQASIHLQNNIFQSAFETSFVGWQLNRALMQQLQSYNNENACEFLLDRGSFLESLILLSSTQYVSCIAELIVTFNIRMAYESFQTWINEHLPILNQLNASTLSNLYRQVKKIYFGSLRRIQYRSFDSGQAQQLQEMTSHMLNLGTIIEKSQNNNHPSSTFDEEEVIELVKEGIDTNHQLDNFCSTLSIDCLLYEISTALLDIRKHMLQNISDLFGSQLDRLSSTSFAIQNYHEWSTHNFETPPSRFD